MIDKGLRVRKGFFSAGLAAGDDISPGTSTSGGMRDRGDGGNNREDRRSDQYGQQITAAQIGTLSDPREKQDYFDQSYVGPSFGFGGGYRDRTSRFGDIFSPSNIVSGLASLISGPLGLATKAFGFLGDKVQDLRGYNPDGTPRTQEEYEQSRFDSQIQNRIDNIMERQRLGKTFSQKNLDELLGMTDMYGNKFSPSTAQNVLTGRDLKGFTSSRGGITSPEVIEKFSNSIGPRAVNVPGAGITKFANPIGPRAVNVPGAGIMGIDVGFDDPAFDNALQSKSDLAPEFQNMAIRASGTVGNYSQNAVANQLYGQDYRVLDPFTQQQIDKLIDDIGTKSTGELASGTSSDYI